jgi:hypothetical protein
MPICIAAQAPAEAMLGEDSLSEIAQNFVRAGAEIATP